MLFPHALQELEVGSKLGVELLWCIAGHLQAAAASRPVGRKRGRDDVTTYRDAVTHLLNVPLTIRGRREEVEDRAVVPDCVPRGRKRNLENVGHQPRHPFGLLSKPVASLRECDTGDVENGDIAVALGQQTVHESGSASANVDDGR